MKNLITEYFPGLNFKPYYHVSWGSFLEKGNWRQLESTHRLNYFCVLQDLSSNSPPQLHAYLATLRDFCFCFWFCLGLYKILPTSCSLSCCFFCFSFKSLHGWILLIIQTSAQKAFWPCNPKSPSLTLLSHNTYHSLKMILVILVMHLFTCLLFAFFHQHVNSMKMGVLTVLFTTESTGLRTALDTGGMFNK